MERKKKVKILITGSKGFIGSRLKERIIKENGYEVLEYNIENTLNELEEYCRVCDIVFHFAAVQRPSDLKEFNNNINLTKTLIDYLETQKNSSPIVFTSSIQAELDNDYGKTKKEEEMLLVSAQEKGRKVYIYRLTNVFGPGSKPNYTSVVATFCYNISHDLPIVINDQNRVMNLIYIDDVIESFFGKINNNDSGTNIENVYSITLSELANSIRQIKDGESNMIKNSIKIKLENTYKYFQKLIL